MTTSGHNGALRQVRIADLIVPIREKPTLRIRKPAPGAPPLNRVPIPKSLGLDIDIVELLLEERQNHR